MSGARRLSKRWLILALGAGLCACGGVPTPTVVEQAAAKLESREARHLTTVRPRLLREAREHLRRARRAVLEEDADAAELYGHLSLQRYETAAGFTARDLIGARMGAMDAALSDITDRADALTAERAALLKVKAAEERLAALDRAKDGESEERKASRRRLVEARQRQAQAVALGAARRAPGPFGAGQALLESGIEALSGDLFAEAREAAAGAIARFDEAIARAREAAKAEADAAQDEAAADALQAAEIEAARDAVTAAELARAEALGRGLDRRDRARFEKGAALVDMARRALADTRPADARSRALEAVEVLSQRPDEPAPAVVDAVDAAGGVAGSAAEAAIVEARTRRATALGQGEDRRCPDVFRGVDALIELAEDRQKAGATAEALTAATRAQERLQTCATAPLPTAAALETARPEGRAAAEQKIAEAQQALARARAARVDPARIEAATGLIADARGWLGGGAWDRAGALADQAREMLSTAMPVAGAPDPALAEARAALARSRALGRRHADRTDDPLHGAAQGMEAEAERLLAAGRGDEALRVANQAAAAWQSILPKVEESKGEGAPPPEDWRPAYREILATLALRDRADAMAGPAARAAVDGGDRAMAEARAAYQKRDYGEARRATALAAASFRQAIDGSAPPPAPTRPPVVEQPQPGLKAAAPADPPKETAPPAEPPPNDAARAAELEAAKAKAAREAIEAAAAERAAAEAAARAAQDAERAEAERKLLEARDAEAAARAALAAAEQDAKARESARANAEARRAEARSWLDGARKRQVQCLREGCEARDPVAWARAEEALRSAETALEDDALDATVDAAQRAISLMDAIASKPAPFTVPAQGEVRRDGDRLKLRTRLRFRSGKATLRPGAEQALDALAKVITENTATIQRVRLVGFTDDRGPEEGNLKLSAARAEAVRDALITRGVSSDVLVAEGRGEAEPAFDNGTAEGRRKNRRVEIRLELREGQ